jgi:glycosyltransferase involved in cell wall biosynthesis
MPFFSIVIPLYNKANFILATLKSVSDQTFENYEIIVINDGSTDESLSKIEALKLPKLSIHNQENKGLSAARNRGVTLARGQYVALLDADDIWKPTYLKSMFKLIENYPNHQIFGCTYKESRNGRLMDIRTSFEAQLNQESYVLDDFFSANYKQFIVDQSSLIFDRNFIKTHTFNEHIDVSEDVDYYLNYFASQQIIFLNRSLMIKTYDDNDQLSSSKISKKRVPDLEHYKTRYSSNTSIQKYIDIQLYKLAIKYTYENNKSKRQKCMTQINPLHLSMKQRLLLKSPKWIMLGLRKLKFLALKLNIRITT